MKRTLLLALMLLLACGAKSQATVTVVGNDGNNRQFAVDATGEIYFGTDYMAVLPSASADMTVIQMDDVHKVLFDGQLNIIDASEAPTLTLMPNPATESFALHGMGEEAQTVTVYSMSGAQVLQGRYTDGEQIDIATLAKGIYMVRAGMSIVKLIKR